ncbi:hypothetical protein ACFOKC_00990 [Halobacterium litoreum]|uniref:CD-NTase-associated protein 15 domain-containing protein n=2 Tax=Halobacterium litoreum TaxID=2039234 RepID=A0ABD5NAP3_9EURY
MLFAVLFTWFYQASLVGLFEKLPLLSEDTLPPGLPTLSIFTLTYIIWDRYLWRFPVIRKFTSMPDLNGEWYGGLQSSYEQTTMGDFQADGGTEKHGPKMTIDQTWTSIQVTIEFKNSVSSSQTASIMHDMTTPVLRLTYQNRPTGDSQESMTIHEGTNDLHLRQQGDERFLEGKYYTDEHRNNHGQVRFKQDERSLGQQILD